VRNNLPPVYRLVKDEDLRALQERLYALTDDTHGATAKVLHAAVHLIKKFRDPANAVLAKKRDGTKCNPPDEELSELIHRLKTRCIESCAHTCDSNCALETVCEHFCASDELLVPDLIYALRKRL
jgi:hypothetical protein